MVSDENPRSGPPRGPVDATRVPRFAGPPTFARLPRIDEVSDVDVAVVGVPFDGGVSYRPGARFGPAHVRASSRLLRPYNPAADVEPFATQQVVDAGDLAVNPFDIAGQADAIHAALEMPAEERAARIRGLRSHVREHDLAEWVEGQLADLDATAAPARP